MRTLFATLFAALSVAVGPALADTPSHPDNDALDGLGATLFVAPQLSVTGTLSCSSCHDPASGFANGDPKVNAGGSVVEGAVPGRFGNRKPPSAAYQGLAPPLHHAITDEGLTMIGGDFIDGRADGDESGSPLADQAKGPFLNPQEMAMPDSGCVVLRACQMQGDGLLSSLDPADCAAVEKAGIGTACRNPDAKITFDDATRAASDRAFDLIARAIAAYERSDAVEQFSSRFDDYWRGTGTLSAEEMAGLKLFEGKAKCSGCHVVTAGPDGRPPLFTDFTYDNLGVPKNPENPWYTQAANKEGKAYLDKGLYVTLQADPIYAPYAEKFLGAEKVPTLRNLFVGQSRSYMHNGWFKSVAVVVHFYNTRDVLSRCKGTPTEAEALAQNCWPAPEIELTMNREELGDLKLSAKEEAELVAFLKTLTDR